MKVAIIGTGYVGLVAGACFADTGNEVFCVDKDLAKIERLKRGEVPIYEPGLLELIERNVKEDRLFFGANTDEAVKNSEIIFMAVGTPPTETGEADLRFLKEACEEVARAMNGPRIIVNKSTVPVGTHLKVTEWMKRFTTHPFEVVSNPEFMKEGAAIDDFLKPDRVVIGASSDAAYSRIAALYAPFVRQGNPILRMDPISAELTKYAANSYLATRISFMNELSVLCDAVGGDIEKVRVGMSTDTRIGRAFLYAGVGYGGSCFPKDVQALIATGKRVDVSLGIIEAAEEANQRQKHLLASKVKRFFQGEIKGKTFCVWGLAFKPNTDDMREAASITIIQDLLRDGAKIKAFDPVAMEQARRFLDQGVEFCETAYEATEGCDGLLLVTEWNEFKSPDFTRLKRNLKTPVIFDGRNVFSPTLIRGEGFSYIGIGRS